MKELWKSFKLLFFFLIFPVTANSFELSEYGLDLNNFSELDILNKSLSLKELSMGMSGDYEVAINFNSTFVRIGSLIFGQRA